MKTTEAAIDFGKAIKEVAAFCTSLHRTALNRRVFTHCPGGYDRHPEKAASPEVALRTTMWSVEEIAALLK